MVGWVGAVPGVEGEEYFLSCLFLSAHDVPQPRSPGTYCVCLGQMEERRQSKENHR